MREFTLATHRASTYISLSLAQAIGLRRAETVVCVFFFCFIWAAVNNDYSRTQKNTTHHIAQLRTFANLLIICAQAEGENETKKSATKEAHKKELLE